MALSKMPLPPLMLLREPSLALFDGEAAVKQRNSQDTVVYCTSLQVVAKLAWAIVHNRKIPPNFILAYLRSLKLHWACFCAMHSTTGSLSCRIITWSGTGTYAFCHYDPPRCQYFMNLDALYASCTHREPYLPIGDGKLKPDSHLGRYLLSDDPDSACEPFLNALYIPGYLGEPDEEDVHQLGRIILGDPERLLAGYIMTSDSGSSSSSELLPAAARAQYKSFGAQVASPFGQALQRTWLGV
ncbi:hypothetical protein DFH09DRAFT_1272078 [Mycena vulgaris]|nr:hypothetical protein DFH09DRAFT_1280883 [Mycena vulgaris]KAJ6598325.1 hypothetical protein DFH09DRAFT_1272078 [Mycena vulgaris]